MFEFFENYNFTEITSFYIWKWKNKNQLEPIWHKYYAFKVNSLNSKIVQSDLDVLKLTQAIFFNLGICFIPLGLFSFRGSIWNCNKNKRGAKRIAHSHEWELKMWFFHGLIIKIGCPNFFSDCSKRDYTQREFSSTRFL